MIKFFIENAALNSLIIYSFIAAHVYFNTNNRAAMRFYAVHSKNKNASFRGLVLKSIEIWKYQNTITNALFCLIIGMAAGSFSSPATWCAGLSTGSFVIYLAYNVLEYFTYKSIYWNDHKSNLAVYLYCLRCKA